MASLSTAKATGLRTIQFTGSDRRRRTVRLGKIDKRTAESIKFRIERLNAARLAGHAPDDETARWVARLDDVMHEKLAAVGLVPPREELSRSMVTYIADYIAGRKTLKPRTVAKLRTTERELGTFFGPKATLTDVTAGDADRFREHLAGRGLLDNTVRKHIAIAKQFFRAAVRSRLIEANPFEDLASTIRPNRARQQFVTRGEIEAVLAQCPDVEWRLIIGLSRYGGLRCPSEVFALRWSDIDWERRTLTVRSPKTEHHAGRESRVVPLFPELVVPLTEAREATPASSEWVITRYREHADLRTRMTKFVLRAGLEPWPELFH